MNPEVQAPPQRAVGRRFPPAAVVAGLAGLALLVAVASTAVGAVPLELATVVRALLADDGSRARLYVWELRLPRALVGALVGANLAVAGAILQGVTRNPLAGPGLMGVNAGAALAVVALTVAVPSFPALWLPAAAFVGGAAASTVAFILAARGGMTPVRLALAGAATASALGAITSALLLIDEETTANLLFWLTGGLAGRGWEHWALLWPWAGAGLAVAFATAGWLNVLSLGEEAAQGLGLDPERTHLALAAVTVVLAGSAVAVAGPVGFVGLVVPHLARRLVGVDHRWLLPTSALLGGVLLMGADVAARMVARPVELPVGVFTAVLGGPFLLRWLRREQA